MGLFDKKYCDFCGEKIGLLGDKKLADGHMCKNCEKKMSDYIKDRKKWQVYEMKAHLKERERNYETLQTINVTDVFAEGRNRVYVDCNQGYFFQCWTDRYMSENPDLIGFWQVTGATSEIRESKNELYFEAEKEDTKRKERIYYEPKEYEYQYDFYVTVTLKEFYVNSITFRVNDNSVIGCYCPEYKDYENAMIRIKNAFDQMAAGANPVVIPEPVILDPPTRMEMEKKQRVFDEQRNRRMERFENKFFAKNQPVPNQGPGNNQHPGPGNNHGPNNNQRPGSGNNHGPNNNQPRPQGPGPQNHGRGAVDK